jgi:N-acetylglucosamine-6-sulfatase
MGAGGDDHRIFHDYPLHSIPVPVRTCCLRVHIHVVCMVCVRFIARARQGFHMGQHCLGPCKRQPYDTDIRIPLYARGPGIAPGSVVHELAGLPDLAPTILEITGAAPDAGMDGKSMMPLLDAYSRPAVGARASWRGAFLIEYIATQEYAKEDAFGHVIDAGNNTFRGLRVISELEDLAYFEFTDCVRDWGWQDIQFHELFNLTVDPQQMHNIWNQTEPALQQELALRLRTQYSCSGATCQ